MRSSIATLGTAEFQVGKKKKAVDDAYTALQGMATYAPANTAYAKTAITTKLTAMKTAQDVELAAAAAEWDFHNVMLAVKEQVVAQYGKSSDQVQSLGLKKKTEYKAPARKAKVAK